MLQEFENGGLSNMTTKVLDSIQRMKLISVFSLSLTLIKYVLKLVRKEQHYMQSNKRSKTIFEKLVVE